MAMTGMTRVALCAMACIAASAIEASAQDAKTQPPRPQDQLDYGRELFMAWCSNCHGAAAGESSFAPALFGVFGRKAGTAEGYAYTGRITSLDLVWTAETLDLWLSELSTESPTTSIRHLGIQNRQARAALVAYVATLKLQ